MDGGWMRSAPQAPSASLAPPVQRLLPEVPQDTGRLHPTLRLTVLKPRSVLCLGTSCGLPL